MALIFNWHLYKLTATVLLNSNEVRFWELSPKATSGPAARSLHQAPCCKKNKGTFFFAL